MKQIHTSKVLLFSFIGLAFLSCVSYGDKIQKKWLNEQSEQLYKKGYAFEKKGETIEAIKEYSEVLEFFPNTIHWPIVCLRMSKLFLEKNNIQDSELVLNRLKTHSEYAEKFHNEIFAAEFNFYAKRKLFGELLQWLDKKEDLSINKFKDSEVNQKNLRELCFMPEFSLDLLYQIHKKLNVDKAIQKTLSFVVEKLLVLESKLAQTLLEKSLKNKEIGDVLLCVTLMQKQAYFKEIHESFKVFSVKDLQESSLNAWIKTLQKGKMWNELEELLVQLDGEQYAIDLYLTYVGLGKWLNAYKIVHKNHKWIFSSLNYEQVLELLRSLSKDKFSKALSDELFSLIKNKEMKAMLKSELETDVDKKAEMIEHVIKSNSLYAEKAHLLLAQHYFVKRNEDGLDRVYNLLIKSYPKSKYKVEIEGKIQTLNAMLSVKEADVVVP